jgi:hypothetical protein
MRIPGVFSVTCLSSALLLAFLSSSSRATVVWDESVSGDLSNNQAAPTAITLSSGINSVIGTVGGTDKQDWIALTIPAGFQLSSDVLENYVSNDAQGFTGVQAGSSFVGSVNTPGSYLGYSHFGTGATNGALPPTNLIGVDLLPLMGDNVNISAGSAGFTPPLPSGTYTFLIQQLGASTAYQFDYGVTAVPEPTSIGLLVGGAMLALRRRTRRA